MSVEKGLLYSRGKTLYLCSWTADIARFFLDISCHGVRPTFRCYLPTHGYRSMLSAPHCKRWFCLPRVQTSGTTAMRFPEKSGLSVRFKVSPHRLLICFCGQRRGPLTSITFSCFAAGTVMDMILKHWLPLRAFHSLAALCVCVCVCPDCGGADLKAKWNELFILKEHLVR